MIAKQPIFPDRVRRVPNQFSWVDQRLVRDGHVDRLSPASAALYLFLVTVADARGLSYYADATLMQRLSLDAPLFAQSRGQLIQGDLIAYCRPIYQVLPLGKSLDALSPRVARSCGSPQKLGEIFKQIMRTAP